MTKEEILGMKAGLDLNNLVCEVIFEWKTFGSVKPYSTDISAAWQVAERMREEGYNLHIEYYSPKVKWAPKDKLTQVLFSNWQGIYQDEVRGDIPMPEAICKAALLAKLKGGESNAGE